MLCAKIGNISVPSTSRKTRFASKSYVRTRGQGMQKPNPRGCCGNPGICLECAQGQKKLKRLATRDALHESRPNLRQRDPNRRIAPSDVSDKGVSTKRRARRKKRNDDCTYTCTFRSLHPRGLHLSRVKSLTQDVLNVDEQKEQIIAKNACAHTKHTG